MPDYERMSEPIADTSASSMSAPAEAPSFELRFRPSVELISVVRHFVADFYLKVLPDEDMASRLALATHELLENAAKYSIDGEAVLQVELDSAAGTIFVRISNRAASAQIEALRRLFDEISAAEDAATFYAQLVRRSAARTSGSGGLGLARVWAESEMSMRLLIEGNRIQIHARGQIAAAG